MGKLIYPSHGRALNTGLDFRIMIVPHQDRAPAERVSLLWILMSRKVGHSKHTGRWFQTKLVLLMSYKLGWLAGLPWHPFLPL